LGLRSPDANGTTSPLGVTCTTQPRHFAGDLPCHHFGSKKLTLSET
jgi:hypothetical protein